MPFVSRSLSGSREAGTLQFPEKPLVQGLHVVVHTCRLPCSATQHTTETENSQAPAHRAADSAFFQETNSGTRNRLISQTPALALRSPTHLQKCAEGLLAYRVILGRVQEQKQNPDGDLSPVSASMAAGIPSIVFHRTAGSTRYSPARPAYPPPIPCSAFSIVG